MYDKHYSPDDEPMRGTLRRKLNRWLFDFSSVVCRRVNTVITILIISSVLISMAGTLENLNEIERTLFRVFEIGITLLFLLEYLLRLYAARRPMAYAFSFYGLIDLLTILPLLLFADPNTTIRMVRLFRLLKLIRYLHVLHTFYAALRDVVDIMLAVTASISVVILVAGNLIYFLEPQNIHNAFQGCWWSLVTMTTVGYGDIVPHTSGGQVVAAILIIIGITMFAMLTGTVTVKISHVLQRTRTCPKCGRKTSEEYHYCPYCSHDLRQDDATDRENADSR